MNPQVLHGDALFTPPLQPVQTPQPSAMLPDFRWAMDKECEQVTCVLTEKECLLGNPTQARQLSSQTFSNKLKVSLFDKVHAIDFFFPPQQVRLH